MRERGGGRVRDACGVVANRWEEELAKIMVAMMRVQRGNMIDVGANIGSISVRAASTLRGTLCLPLLPRLRTCAAASGVCLRRLRTPSLGACVTFQQQCRGCRHANSFVRADGHECGTAARVCASEQIDEPACEPVHPARWT